MKRKINLDDMQFLSSIAMLAAERYRENAATFAAMVDKVPDPNALMQITGQRAKDFADMYTAQAAQASMFCQLFGAITDDFVVEYDPELVEEED